MTGSIKRPDITEVGSSALILKRFERSEAVERLERLEPSHAPAHWKDALAQLGIPNGDRGEMRGLWSGVWPESGLYRVQFSNNRNRVAKRHPLHVWAFQSVQNGTVFTTH